MVQWHVMHDLPKFKVLENIYFKKEKWGNSHSCSTLQIPIQSHTHTWYSLKPHSYILHLELDQTSLALKICHTPWYFGHTRTRPSNKVHQMWFSSSPSPPERKRKRVRNHLAQVKKGERWKKLESNTTQGHPLHSLALDQNSRMTWPLRDKLFDLAK
jgi:hypothetical protein